MDKNNDTYQNIMPMDEQFYAKVYEQVAKIPAGKVCTYGKIAELAGYEKASREVGIAMSEARVKDLPYHRVVNKKGTLAPEHVFGGAQQQKQMLLAEGVVFKKDDSIDMSVCLWPEEKLPFEQLTFL